MPRRSDLVSWLASMIALLGCLAPGCAQGGGGLPQSGGRDAGVVLDARAPLDAAVKPYDDAALRADAGEGEEPEDGGSGNRPDAHRGCSSAAECDDGSRCNGIERCELGTCVDGDPLVCDDGLACTVDTCVEPGSCSFASTCPTGDTCTASGCNALVTCDESPCRVLSPQCGCGAGNACYVEGGARTCARSGTGSEGDSCEDNADCAAGLSCVELSEVSSESWRQCARYCGSSADCVGPGSLCVGTVRGPGGAPMTDLGTCSRSCDPFDSFGCAPGLKCNVYYTEDSSSRPTFLTECVGPIGYGWGGDRCSRESDCDIGSTCIGGTCRDWCDVDQPLSCGILGSCVGFDTPVVFGGIEYGVCD